MENFKPKSFFERPEGKTGMLFIVIGVFAFFVIGDRLLPFIIGVLQNTLHALILGGVILGIVYLAMNKKFQILVKNLFQGAMRMITGFFITIDPIGILKNYIEDMKNKIAEMERQLARLLGERTNLDDIIAERKKAAEKSAELAQAAKKLGDNEKVMSEMSKVARAREFVEKMTATRDKIDLIYRVIDKMKKNVKFLLDDTEDEVKTREIEYVSIKSANKAMGLAVRLIQGDEAKELFDQSMEFIAHDISVKIAEMERAMDATNDFMKTSNLHQGVLNEKGLNILQELENGGSIFSYEKNKTTKTAVSANISEGNNNFSAFFK